VYSSPKRVIVEYADGIRSSAVEASDGCPSGGEEETDEEETGSGGELRSAGWRTA
jgi:hypothetical protein